MIQHHRRGCYMSRAYRKRKVFNRVKKLYFIRNRKQVILFTYNHFPIRTISPSIVGYFVSASHFVHHYSTNDKNNQSRTALWCLCLVVPVSISCTYRCSSSHHTSGTTAEKWKSKRNKMISIFIS